MAENVQDQNENQSTDDKCKPFITQKLFEDISYSEYSHAVGILNGIFFQIWTFWLQKSPSSHCTTPDFIHNGACYPDFLSPRRVPMECRQSIHRLGGCHWAEINMLPMLFFWEVKGSNIMQHHCNILILGDIKTSHFLTKNIMKNLLQRGRLEVDLSAKGLGEAKSAGGLLKSEGIKVDMAFTSYLKRHLATVSLSLQQWTL